MFLANQPAGGDQIWGMIVPFVLMFAVFYFLLIRPQQRKQKMKMSMLNQLKKGDKVVTIGGMHGTIQEIADDTVVLRVNDTTRITFDRSAINNVTQVAPSAAEPAAKPAKTEKAEKIGEEKA